LLHALSKIKIKIWSFEDRHTNLSKKKKKKKDRFGLNLNICASMYLSIVASKKSEKKQTKMVLEALKTNSFCVKFGRMHSKQHQTFHKPNFIMSWKNKVYKALKFKTT
jgi:hypothetical protein